ncbi:MAG: phosphatase PAP2 family protein [Chloroflexota bacterium]
MTRLRGWRLPPYAGGLLVAAIIVLFWYLNIPLTVEWMAVFLGLAAATSGRGRMFLLDWGPFVLALLAWQITAPIATELPFPWHLTDLISADSFIFAGYASPQWLQAHLYHGGTQEPWDVFATTMYMLHFVAPLLAGFLLWIKNRSLFRQYTLAFVLVAVMGYITWIVYPAVPPWMAGERLLHVGHIYVKSASGHIYLPGVHNLFDAFARHWYNPYNGQITLGFLHGHVDQVGAMPSEHAAFPFLSFLFLRRQFGKPAYLALLYIAGLTFSVMYLGQHYFVDVLAGFAYATVAYIAAVAGVPALRSHPVPAFLFPIAGLRYLQRTMGRTPRAEELDISRSE